MSGGGPISRSGEALQVLDHIDLELIGEALRLAEALEVDGVLGEVVQLVRVELVARFIVSGTFLRCLRRSVGDAAGFVSALRAIA